MPIQRFRRACVALVSLSLLSLGVQVPAAAGVVGTAEAIAAGDGPDGRATLGAMMARDDIRKELVALGVDPAEVAGRLAALTDAEVAALAARIGDAPAGGDMLAVVGVLFIVLMILEFTGVIDIFKKA